MSLPLEKLIAAAAAHMFLYGAGVYLGMNELLATGLSFVLVLELLQERPE